MQKPALLKRAFVINSYTAGLKVSLLLTYDAPRMTRKSIATIAITNRI